MCFEIFNNEFNNKQDGVYTKDIPTFEEFKAIYGQIQLIYSVQNGTVVVEDIKPSEFLLDGYRRDLETYRGMPYRNAKDKFKIDMFMAMKGK